MNPMSSFISFLLATLCLTAESSRVILTESPGPNLIKKACENAPNQSLCIDILNSNPDSKKSDLKQLAFIAFQVASKNAADTSEMIRKSLFEDDNKVVDSSEEPIISDCSESYNNIVNLIDDSVDALATGPGKDVENEMDAAIAAIDTCAASINRLKGQSLEVYRRNQNVKQLCENALSVYHVFAKN